MRILVVSDIHANWPALEAIREPFDCCLFLGDLVDYGLEIAPCLEWVRRHMTHGVRGNHDHGAAQAVMVQGAAGHKYLSGVTRTLSIQMLAEHDRRFLACLPTFKYLTLDGKRFLLVHGSPREPMDDYVAADADTWAERLQGIDVDFVLCGHTHMPYQVPVGRITVVNPGSVGLPRDGDHRASYAIIDGGVVTHHRIDYPIERTIEVIQASTLPHRAKDMLTEIYRHGRLGNGRANGK